MNQPAVRVPEYFTPGQWRLLVLGMSFVSAALVVWVLYKVMSLAQLFVATFSIVIWPLAIAAILATLLRPSVFWLEKHLRIPRVRAIILLYFFVVAVCVAAATLFVPIVFGQSVVMLERLPALLMEKVPAAIMEVGHYIDKQAKAYPQIFGGLQTYFNREEMTRVATELVAWLQTHAHQAPAALGLAKDKIIHVFEWTAAAAVIPIYLFFLLETEHDLLADLRKQLTFLRPEVRYDLVFLIEQFMAILNSFFRGQILVGLCLGVIKAVGFTLIGLEFGLVLGLVFGMLNVIPYLGTILGLSVVLPIALFQPDGGLYLVALAGGVFVAAHLIEAYVLMPKIMGDKTGLHPMVIILSIFFWGKAFNGILGMILGVPLTAFIVVAWRLVRAKYLPTHGTGQTRTPFKAGGAAPPAPAAAG